MEHRERNDLDLVTAQRWQEAIRTHAEWARKWIIEGKPDMAIASQRKAANLYADLVRSGFGA